MSGQPNQGKFVKVKVNLNAPKKRNSKNLQKTTKKIKINNTREH